MVPVHPVARSLCNLETIGRSVLLGNTMGAGVSSFLSLPPNTLRKKICKNGIQRSVLNLFPLGGFQPQRGPGAIYRACRDCSGNISIRLTSTAFASTTDANEQAARTAKEKAPAQERRGLKKRESGLDVPSRAQTIPTGTCLNKLHSFAARQRGCLFRVFPKLADVRSASTSIRRTCRAASTSDLNSRALTPGRGRLRLVRKSTRPRGGLERDAQQSVAAPRIADLAAIEIHELLATSAVGPPHCPDCVPLLCPAGHTGHPSWRVARAYVERATHLREGQNGLRLNDIQRPAKPEQQRMTALLYLAIIDTQNGLKKVVGKRNCISFLNAHCKDRDCRRR